MRKDDPAQTEIVAATTRALVRAKKKPLTFAVAKILKTSRFSPLTILINQVFPTLEPDKQADVLLKLMQFLYPQINRVEGDGKKRKSGLFQVNTQVLTGQPQHQPANPQLSLEALLKLASGEGEK